MKSEEYELLRKKEKYVHKHLHINCADLAYHLLQTEDKIRMPILTQILQKSGEIFDFLIGDTTLIEKEEEEERKKKYEELHKFDWMFNKSN